MTACDFSSFSPHPFARSGHTQTLIAAYFRPRGLPYCAEQHVVELHDGDAIVLHDDCPEGWSSGERAVLLVHGLAGCHGSPYLVRTAAKLNRAGIRTFRMDLRGMGAAQKCAVQVAHAGRSEDVLAAAQKVATLCEGSAVSLIGYSMGGNLVLKLLGEAAERLPAAIDSALCIAPPIDLSLCCGRLEQGPGRWYSRAFTRMLVRLVRQRPHIEARLPRVLSPPPRGLWEFDDRVTAPLSGFSSAAEYYQRSSAARVLDRIQLPTWIVAADDDPVVPAEMFDHYTFAATTSVQVTRGGGHVGFYGTAANDEDRWWLDWRVVDWVLGRDPSSS